MGGRSMTRTVALADLVGARVHLPTGSLTSRRAMKERRKMIDEKRDELATELADLDKKIKQLRKVRAAATYDLEWFVKERDRVKRHLAQRGERSD